MTWPLSQDYNEAIQNPETSFADPELQSGQVVTNTLGLPMPRSGNFADVYEFTCPANKWAIKCFTREVAGLKERYREISNYLQQVSLPFMVDFTYLDPGIRVRGQWFPVLKMRWVEGFALNEIVKKNLDKPQVLDSLLQIWFKVASRLREAQIAHCDLQHGNVLLVTGRKASSVAVKLVDYDGMWVPTLAKFRSAETGHPNFQHPQRVKEGIYSLDVDRFSHLVICTALRCLIVGGQRLWERYDNGDNLLFRLQDLEAPESSALFAELKKLNDPTARQMAEQLFDAAKRPLNQTPLLDTFASTSPMTSTPAIPMAQSTEYPVASAMDRKPKRRSISAFWIGLAGVVSLVVVGLIAMIVVGVSLLSGDKVEQKGLRPNPEQGDIIAAIPLPVNLLTIADPKKNTCKGKWELQGNDLVSIPTAHSVLEIPYTVPEEYTLRLQVVRTGGNDALGMGLVIGDRRCLVVLDAGPMTGYVSGLEMIDGKIVLNNETTKKGPVLKNGTSSEVLCTVRREGIVVAVDGKPVLEYKGSRNRLSLGDFWQTPNQQAMFVGSQNSTTYRISRMEMTALSGVDKAEQEKRKAVLAQELRRWDHLDLANADVMDGFVRIKPNSVLPTKKTYTGPVEITAVVRTNKDNIRLSAFKGGIVIFNWEIKSGEMLITRPDAIAKEQLGSVAVSKQMPLKPDTWYTIRWKIKQEGMEVAVDNKIVFSEDGKYDLSKACPVWVGGYSGSVVDVKSFAVESVAGPFPK